MKNTVYIDPYADEIHSNVDLCGENDLSKYKEALAQKILKIANVIDEAYASKADYVVVPAKIVHLIKLGRILKKNKMLGKLKFANKKINGIYGRKKIK